MRSLRSSDTAQETSIEMEELAVKHTLFMFSPTGGTARVAQALMEPLAGVQETVDLSDRQIDFGALSLSPEDVAWIAVPSFAGRVPVTAMERLSRIQGGGARAVLVCVYGNRAYDDTLLELADGAKAAGFRVAAAVAAVAQHSILSQFGAGRPDERDRCQLSEFGKEIEKALTAEPKEPVLPGSRPYRAGGRGGMIPRPTERCNGCGLCAARCPVGAIDPQDPARIRADACIGCMRCKAVCPQKARDAAAEQLAGLAAKLEKACAGRRENELFLPGQEKEWS